MDKKGQETETESILSFCFLTFLVIAYTTDLKNWERMDNMMCIHKDTSADEHAHI